MANVALGLVMAVTVVFDWKYRRIPNWIVLPLMMFGFLWNGIALGWSGVTGALLGLVVGFSLLFIPFALRGVGAGDVKLLAAIGSLGGVEFVVAVFLYGAMIGGCMAVVVLLRRGSLHTLGNLVGGIVMMVSGSSNATLAAKTLDHGRDRGVPYGVAMAVGVILVWWLGVPW